MKNLSIALLPAMAIAFGIASVSPVVAAAPVGASAGWNWVDVWTADFEDPDNWRTDGLRYDLGIDYAPGGGWIFSTESLPGVGNYYLANETAGTTEFGFRRQDGPALNDPDWGVPNFADMLKLQFDIVYLGDWNVGDGGPESEIPMFLNLDLDGTIHRLAMDAATGGTFLGAGAIGNSMAAPIYRYEYLLPYAEEWSFSLTGAGTYQQASWQGWGIDNIRLLAAAIPEPSSWMLLIAGFGFIGFSMRRKRVRMVVFD